MYELIILGVFALTIIGCMLAGLSIIYALIFGLLMFSLYSLKIGYAPRQVFEMYKNGIKPLTPMFVNIILIGIMTAFWKAGGTIPAIIYYASNLLNPEIILLLSFWLCCIVSVLTGAAFITAATMGIICITAAIGMGVPALYAGGAILSGVYFGNRCSHLSNSAVLISTLTATNITYNIKNMIRTSKIPFALASLFYLILGFVITPTAAVDVEQIFNNSFEINLYLLLPALLIIIFSLLRWNVQRIMIISIIASAACTLWIQDNSAAEVLTFAISGYQPYDMETAEILSGGGIISILNVFAIACISACYAGIFYSTNLLNNLDKLLIWAEQKFKSFGVIALISVVTAALSCNQTLTIMLTHQFCKDVEQKPNILALSLANTAVVIPALIPWSVAAVLPLTLISAPSESILFAFYLYLLPLVNFKTKWFNRELV